MVDGGQGYANVYRLGNVVVTDAVMVLTPET